jgi:thymidine phosphorylase
VIEDSKAGRHNSRLRLQHLGIDTYREHVIYMNRDCHICRAEGFVVRSRVAVRLGERRVIATLNVVLGDMLSTEEAGLSESAWNKLCAQPGSVIEISHPDPLASESSLRKKVYGGTLDRNELSAIIGDVAASVYDDIQLAAFVTACAGDRLSFSETADLTGAMIDVGDRLTWDTKLVADKHCVGGLPGNRTSMIVVPIIAAAGLIIPKTSSRAITSPAGTADAMETLTRVDLSIAEIRKVVEREGGCIAWGGAVRLSPADDILIGVERPLDFDSEGQLVASVLSKKIAAGSTHVVLDLPVGPTAKLRSLDAAAALAQRLKHVAAVFALTIDIVTTDGTQPVGRGIGPALEARDVLTVLKNERDAPDDLRSRALALAGRLLELAAAAPVGAGLSRATHILDSGAAWAKFQAICEAQGSMRELGSALYRIEVTAKRQGYVTAIDNRKLAKTAKLAGAPRAALAGVDFHAPIGKEVQYGEPLYTIHAESEGELNYSLTYALVHENIVQIGEAP